MGRIFSCVSRLGLGAVCRFTVPQFATMVALDNHFAAFKDKGGRRSNWFDRLTVNEQVVGSIPMGPALYTLTPFQKFNEIQGEDEANKS